MNYISYFHLSETLYNYNSEKKIILEPFCCLIRICLLNYKLDNTKLCINENSIDYIEPSIYQGLYRQLSGDNREDLHNLYSPIIKSFEWYSKDLEHYKYIYQKCIDGLNKLIGTYDKNSTIYHTLNQYKTLIENHINGCDKYNKVGESPLINKMESFWTDSEKKLIYKNLKIVEETKNNIYIETIENILKNKEQMVNEYIISNSESYN